jgi:parallel beta-helix repeat protein
MSAKVDLSGTVSGSGVYNVTLRVVPVSGETSIADNVVQGYVGTEYGTINVPAYYPTIQEAVDAASSGDTIRVSSGVYNEAVHVCQPNISLTGQSKETTIINGSGLEWAPSVVYLIYVKNVCISEFTLKNSGKVEAFYSSAGVALFDGSENCTVSNNIISNNNMGIYLWNSFNNTITSNNINKSKYGIVLLRLSTGGEGNLFTNNTVELSTDTGIALLKVPSASGIEIISGNVIKRNVYGIQVCGNSSLVVRNKVVENTNYGIMLDESTEVTIRDNHLRGNGQGINVTSASGNRIYYNNFINNTDQVSGTSINKWHDLWNVTGNYWSDYAGSDLDGDGIGNTPYIIDADNKDNFPFMNPYLPGDINHDGRVNIVDLNIISRAYGSYPGHPNWNPRADINEDAVINIKDINIASANFGKTWKDYWGE